MTDTPLACPFCGAAPRLAYLAGAEMAGCVTKGCVAAHAWTLVAAWNTRAPAAEPDQINERHPHADVARLCIVNARLELIGLCISADQEPSVRRFERWLQQALDALRPPAAPVSVALWVGREA